LERDYKHYYYIIRGKEVYSEKLVSWYVESGVTTDSFSIDKSIDYDTYKIVKNGFYAIVSE
jgi:hypothetical protein